MLRSLTTLCLALITLSVFGQMPSDDIVRYGNEWIDYDKNYLRIATAEDGVYRITPAQLTAAGFAGTDDNWVLYHEGKVVPIEVTTEGITFAGSRNDGAMDRFLFPDPASLQLNDRFSMHTDTAAYYLTRGEDGLRYTAPAVTGTPQERTSILRKAEKIYGDYQSKSFFRSGSSSIFYSHYDEAEGFGSRSPNDLLSRNGNRASVTELDLPGSNGGAATLDLRFGLAFDGHLVKVEADGTELTTVTRSRWNVVQLSLPFTPAGATTTINVEGTRADRDKPNLAWLEVTYPAELTYDDRMTEFTVPASARATRITLTGLGAAAGANTVIKGFAPVAGTMFSAEIAANGTATIDLPAATTELTYYLTTGNDLGDATLSTRSFTTTLPTNGNVNYLLLTSRRLHGPAVEELAGYRRSFAGGGYNVLVTDVEDLYDEFGYGVNRHPMALRNYLAAARIAAPGLRYLFLVGKGREYEDLRRPGQVDSARATFFIPSFGYPASDNLLSADLGEVIPNLATGRLAAINEQEIAIYAKKLRDVEEQINTGDQTISDRDWMKQVMHLGGGTTPGEQSSIKSRLTTMVNTISDSRMAPNVTSFFKSSSDPLEDSRSAAIFNRINEGLSILSFMGHSSSQTFDFSIDDPANYRNAGKYPFMISLGCYSGDAFTEARSISERFIFLRDKGAVAFAASKGVGFISALGSWGTELYGNLGEEDYGEGVGVALQSTIAHFANSSNFTLGILLEQFALSGDPAYRLHPRPGSDVVIDPASVSFSPDVVPAQDPFYNIHLTLLNLGTKPATDSLTLRFRQVLPNGETVDLTTHRVATPDYANELELTLPNPGIQAVGQNRVLVSVDVNEEEAELPAPAAERNNELISGARPGVPLTFIANTARVAYPPRYAVVGGQDLELIASTTDGLAPVRNYTVQVASDREFTRLLSDEVISSPGGVIRHRPAFTPQDSTTYYWRISPDPATTEGAGFIWSESSMTWLAGQPVEQLDWAQQAPGQTIDGDFVNIVGDTTTFGWRFSKTLTEYTIFNALRTGEDRNIPRLERGGQRIGSPFPFIRPTGMQVYVVDSTSVFDILFNPGGLYNTPIQSAKVWIFDTRLESGRSGMMDFMQNGIDPGKFVFVYSVQTQTDRDYYNADWERDSVNLGGSIFSLLEEEGALEARRIATVGSVPYVFAYQKGLGPLAEVMARNQTDTIVMRANLRTNWPEGTWTSRTVGPAIDWNDVSTKISSRNVESADSVIFQLVGVDRAGSETILRSQLLNLPGELEMITDLREVDQTVYPFLKVRYLFYDEELRTPPTVDYVYFDYKRTGDVAINPQISYTGRDSIAQGQDFNLNVGYENITPIGMDSLLVRLEMVNSRNEELVFTKRVPPLPGRNSGNVGFSVPSTNFSSGLRYQLVINPEQDQPEEVVFNNSLNARLKVGQDVIAPLLTVFYDGRRINNGDLVSGKPEIHIQLRDENRNLALNDTSGYFFELSHPSPDGNYNNRRRERISFSDSRIEFLPAVEGENTAEIFFRPELTENGLYGLEMIGRDRSGNIAGRATYKQDFEVINEQLVANVLTYPNPFTTQTRFVYTLTGNELPSTFRIQIMTVSGRVVRDIDLLAHEDLRIGTHQSNFAWDGTDEYGDMLANGVYLYRVITGDDSGSALEKYDTGTDQFFAREMGKVVILR